MPDVAFIEDRQEAIDALTDAAFTTDEGRVIVHSFLGSFGADMDLDSCIDKVQEASSVAWHDNIFGHDLAAVLDDRKVYCFDVKRPGGEP